jgi:hypothetical protein
MIYRRFPVIVGHPAYAGKPQFPSFRPSHTGTEAPGVLLTGQRIGRRLSAGRANGRTIEDNDMTNYDPNYRSGRTRNDNSGAWIIGIIVLVAIGIGVWWWAGWGGANNGNNVASAPTTSAPATTGSGANNNAATTHPTTTGSGAGSTAPAAPAPSPAPAPANR